MPTDAFSARVSRALDARSRSVVGVVWDAPPVSRSSLFPRGARENGPAALVAAATASEKEKEEKEGRLLIERTPPIFGLLCHLQMF